VSPMPAAPSPTLPGPRGFGQSEALGALILGRSIAEPRPSFSPGPTQGRRSPMAWIMHTLACLSPLHDRRRIFRSPHRFRPDQARTPAGARSPGFFVAPVAVGETYAGDATVSKCRLVNRAISRKGAFRAACPWTALRFADGASPPSGRGSAALPGGRRLPFPAIQSPHSPCL
jgi:hypothetical protein